MSDDYNLRGKVAVVGVGETTYYKHGQSGDPEFVLVLKAILAACEDAGISPKEIDGFCSFPKISPKTMHNLIFRQPKNHGT